MIGLTPKELEILQNVFKKFDNINEVILFGSRALVTHKTASDINLSIKPFKTKIHPRRRYKFVIFF